MQQKIMNYKTYIIDGKEFTAVGLGKELGVSQQTARNRLKTAKTIDDLYNSLHKKKFKSRTIEGKEYTTETLAEELGSSLPLARARLNKCNTLEELLRPIRAHHEEKRVNRYTNESAEEEKMRKLLFGAW